MIGVGIQSFPKIFHIGESMIQNLFKGEVEITEKIDGCVGIEEKILMSNLEYKRAGDICVGDKLIGFDEDLNNQKLRETIVTHAEIIEKECWRLETKSGSIIATTDHPFLVRDVKRKYKGLSKRWFMTEELQKGDRIVYFGQWMKEESYESGYIAGQYDGEGTIINPTVTHGTRRCAYYQKEGDGAELIKGMLERRGFEITLDKRQRKEEWKVCCSLNMLGGFPEILRFLGTFRPQRLLQKIQWENYPLNSVKDTEVISMEYVGKQKVMGITTTERTYIANGLFSHNSQFDFGIKKDGEIVMRSHGQELTNCDIPKMFKKAVEQVERISSFLQEIGNRDIYFYCEYLEKPHHNTLTYSRTPNNNLYLFGIYKGGCWVSDPEILYEWADKIEIEKPNVLYVGSIKNPEELEKYLETDSVLGNTKIEGIVVKNYNEPSMRGSFFIPISMGKYVSEKFKEKHEKGWAKNTSKGKLELFIESFRTEARWDKTIQHLKENDELENEPRDIGKLMKEIDRDIKEEELENIKNILLRIYLPDIQRKAKAGFAEYYKKLLLDKAFERGDEN